LARHHGLHMTLATKNGSLIVTDGKIAENCGCCGGWYCYQESCPCNYSTPMPQSLQATLSFSLASNMYGIADGNFTGAFLSTWRTTPQQASQVNGTYTLTRPSPSINPCWYTFQGNNVDIRVIVGASSGSFNYESLDAGCSALQTNIHLSWLGFKVPAMYPTEYWGSFINNICPGHPTYVNNAAGRTYTRQQTSVSCPATISQAWNDECNWQPAFPFYNLGMRLDGAAGGRDVPDCSIKPLEQINHSWAFDVVYTDTSGSAPVEGRLSRAVTLTVTE
jgi:hypothetical protein